MSRRPQITPAQHLASHKDCECEKDCHFMALPGERIHAYAAAAPVTVVRTPFGMMAVCEACADTCLSMYPRAE